MIPPEPLRTVWLLFLCQSIAQAAMTAQVVMAPLIGLALAPDPALATLPMAVQMGTTMVAALPAAWLAGRFGRAAAFLMGALAYGGAVGASVAALLGQDFALYCLGAALNGIAFGVGQQYRFAASEVAGPEARPKAIALTMAGGVVGALAGPELVTRTHDLVATIQFLGAYLALAALPLLTTLLVTLGRFAPVVPRPEVPVPYRSILARRDFQVACGTAVIAWATMNLVMASTPIAMLACGFTASDGARVIQAHAVAMFLPSFATGHLIARFGPRTVILTGAALTAACALVAIQGVAFHEFWIALVLLGVGWNFLFVGATTLLAAIGTPQERPRIQGLNDLIVFGTVTCTALGSGAFFDAFGWAALNLAILPPTAVVAVLLWRFLRPAAVRPA